MRLLTEASKADLAAINLDERLEFCGIDGGTRNTLKSMAEIVQGVLPAALEEFYAKVRVTPDVARFFQSDAGMKRAENLQRTHWGRILTAEFGDDYVLAVRRVGSIHAKIGLEPRWYIGAYSRILASVIDGLVKQRMRKGRLFGVNSAVIADEVTAITRAALLDMDLAISVYLEDLEAERHRVEKERAASLERIAQALRKIAEGDLTAQIDGDTVRAAPELGDAFGAAIEGLRQIVSSVRDSGAAIKTSTTEITQATEDLAGRTERQAASLEETAATATELSKLVKQSAQDAQKVDETVRIAEAGARQGSAVSARTREAMKQIEHSAGEMSHIITVIDEIAFQTNLLALNAGVEAARAGEAGRGFAVVASEVRALAQRASDAARNIKGLIERSNRHVSEGGELVLETESELTRILEAFGTISGLASGLASSSKEQSLGIDELDSVVSGLDQMTQQNAAMVEETAATVLALDHKASELSNMVAKFTLSNHGHNLPLHRVHG